MNHSDFQSKYLLTSDAYQTFEQKLKNSEKAKIYRFLEIGSHGYYKVA